MRPPRRTLLAASIGFLGRDVAQPGSALAWGARGQGFKSLRPDQFQQLVPEGSEARRRGGDGAGPDARRRTDERPRRDSDGRAEQRSQRATRRRARTSAAHARAARGRTRSRSERARRARGTREEFAARQCRSRSGGHITQMGKVGCAGTAARDCGARDGKALLFRRLPKQQDSRARSMTPRGSNASRGWRAPERKSRDDEMAR